MLIAEPQNTATLLTTFSILLGVSALFGRGFERLGIPVVLAFLAIGVLAGYHAIGDLHFKDYHFAFRVGVVALVIILFDGGLNTPYNSLKRIFFPAVTLATLGVVITAATVTGVARLIGLPWSESLLLGAVVSSTDAAAVFSVLRGTRTQLNHRVATTLEVESGVNDPVAMLLTIAITEQILSGNSTSITFLIGLAILELLIGCAVGAAVAYGGRWLLSKYHPPTGGLVAVATLALAMFAFGAGSFLHGSGFVAVYVAAVGLGNGPIPMRGSVIRFHDAFGWLSQITMFLLLGLLAHPGRVAAQVPTGLILALALTFLARPIAALLCLTPYRYGLRESFYVGWVGLRGAVPIVLAIFPMLAGVPGSERVFDIVFVIVIVTSLIPGSTVRWATRKFGLEEESPPPPGAVLQIEAGQPLDAELLSFYVTPAIAVAGAQLADLPFPEGAAVSMIVRGASLIPPRGSTVLEPGDHVYVITRPEDLTEIQLLFGRPE
ncbi:MAG TPA: potassium/proton antiporter [Longimicrobiales bacterium]|nr:potassium/proton antiporter [Longimicrobiales bacterium]